MSQLKRGGFRIVSFVGHHKVQRHLASLLSFACGVALNVGCASSGSEPEVADFAPMPSAQTLFQKGTSILEHHHKILGIVDTTDYQGAIDRFQDVIDNYPYSDYAVLSELRIADAFYDQKLYDEALSYYRDFAELHPDHQKVPYAMFRAAQCHYEQSSKPNRDQSATRAALKQLSAVMKRYPYSPEAAQAETMWKELRTRLGTSVLEIGDFYLGHKEFQSAASRYREVLDDYPGLGMDAQALYKLGVCYTNMNREDDANGIFEVILENYPGSEVAAAAQDWIPAAN